MGRTDYIFSMNRLRDEDTKLELCTYVRDVLTLGISTDDNYTSFLLCFDSELARRA